MRMKDGWLERLSEAINEDKRSMRALSLEAGLGPNFISQMFNDGKDPGGDKLLSILEVLDQSAIAYIFLGIRIGPDDLAMLREYSAIPEGARQRFREFLRALPGNAETA